MAKKKEWREGEMILTFGLTKIDIPHLTPLMEEWLAADLPILDDREKGNFENLVRKVNKIATWSEEDLKMKFIGPILELGNVMEGDKFTTFFDKKLEAKVNGYALSVRADFVVAKGLLDYMDKPYFHLQAGGVPQYKPDKNPTGDSMAQLLEAFLIAQEKNKNNKPIYGCEVNGGIWRFVIFDSKSYCLSKPYMATDSQELFQIIAIFRKFKEILETRLLD